VSGPHIHGSERGAALPLADRAARFSAPLHAPTLSQIQASQAKVPLKSFW